MATSSNSKRTEPAKLNWWRKKSVLIPLIILAVIGLAVWGVADFLFHNRAADIAAPLEKSLVAAGAAKTCENGDPGRGPDTSAAEYGASYDVRMSKDNAIALMYRVAKDNGYNLTHASPSNRGHIGFIADAYIDQWYFDDSKQQPYWDINPGPINLAFSIDGPGSNYGCRTTSIIPSGHALISLSVDLPDFKR
ncbi:MAG TPA: hypothetical protein VLG40_02815 [Candidatus Saccharimonas sp.]|nr:hypothetical protein [Candidatus Saccharimonas sp.]